MMNAALSNDDDPEARLLRSRTIRAGFLHRFPRGVVAALLALVRASGPYSFDLYGAWSKAPEPPAKGKSALSNEGKSYFTCHRSSRGYKFGYAVAHTDARSKLVEVALTLAGFRCEKQRRGNTHRGRWVWHGLLESPPTCAYCGGIEKHDTTTRRSDTRRQVRGFFGAMVEEDDVGCPTYNSTLGGNVDDNC